MGARSSKLKKEIAALKAEAAAAGAKHVQDVETLRNEKRMLEFKLQALQEMTAKAQVEAEKATQLAIENEEKAKALKWELVRRLSVPASLPPSPSSAISVLTASTSSSVVSLASDTSTSSLPRVPVNWKLKDGVTLRRSNTSIRADELGKSTEAPGSRAHSISTDKQRSSFTNALPATSPVSSSTPVSSTVKLRSSSKEEPVVAAIPVPKPITVAPSLIEPVSSPAPASVPSDFDKFAPVKRRSSTKDSVMTMAAINSAMAESKADKSPRIDSVEMPTPHPVKDVDSENDRVSSRSPSESSGKDDATERAGFKSRGVRAATKGRGPQESKTDTMLALSDDEDD